MSKSKDIDTLEQAFIDAETALYEVLEPEAVPLLVKYKRTYRAFCEARLRHYDEQDRLETMQEGMNVLTEEAEKLGLGWESDK